MKCPRCNVRPIENYPTCGECDGPANGYNAQGQKSSIRIYVDMDNVLTDFDSYFEAEKSRTGNRFPQLLSGFFLNLAPMEGAIESFEYLWQNYDTHILTKPLIQNLHSYTEKAKWIEKYLGHEKLNKLILNCHKDTEHGDYLIDDSTLAGQLSFRGTFIHFGTERWPDWESIIKHNFF